MSKLTCKELKHILPARYHHRIYKSDSNVRIDLKGCRDETVEYVRKELKQYNIVMFRDDLVHLPEDYIVRFELN